MSDIFVTVTKNQNCGGFKELRAGEVLLCSKSNAKDGVYTAQTPHGGALGYVSGRIFSKSDEKGFRKQMEKSSRRFYAQVMFCAGDALVCRIVGKPEKSRARVFGKKISLAV